MAASFRITSTAFKQDEKIPIKYSCDGQDLSPPLTWVHAPPTTQSFALICSDPDAPMGIWYHWVVFNIPKTITDIIENKLPAGSLLGKNSWDKMQYNGPCPPPGKQHHYVFTLFALDTYLHLPTEPDADTLKKSMQGHVLESTTITGLFTRPS